MVLAAISDFFDGYLARRWKQQSSLGRMLDPIADKLLVSSVLMNGIPAQIAGVARRVMVTPPNPEGKISPALLVAAREIGIDEVTLRMTSWDQFGQLRRVMDEVLPAFRE